MLLLWALLAASGMQRFGGSKSGREQGYRISADDLAGVTRLRVEGNYDDGGRAQDRHRYRPKSRVLIGNTGDVRLTVTVRARKIDAQDRAADALPQLTATRENDTLVLRSSQAPAAPQRAGPARLSELQLPVQFAELTLERARIKARAPLARLQVSGSDIAVSGPIAAVDLRSTQCPQPHKKRAYADDASLKIDARGMHSIRVSAASGSVSLHNTDAIGQLELQLSAPVALRVDRAALLDPRRFGAAAGRGHEFGAPRAACTPLRATDPAPGAVALQLLADERAPAAREKYGGR